MAITPLVRHRTTPRKRSAVRRPLNLSIGLRIILFGALCACFAPPNSAIGQGSPIASDEVSLYDVPVTASVERATTTAFRDGDYAVTFTQTTFARGKNDTVNMRPVNRSGDTSDLQSTDGGESIDISLAMPAMSFGPSPGMALTVFGGDESPGVGGDLYLFEPGFPPTFTPIAPEAFVVAAAFGYLREDVMLVTISEQASGEDGIFIQTVDYRLEDPLGSAHGPINTPLGGSLRQPRAGVIVESKAPRAGGEPSLLVTWQSAGAPGDGSGITVQGRLLDDDFQPLGDQFQISDPAFQFATGADLAANPRGGALVVWESNGSNGTDMSSFSIQARRINAQGGLAGPQFQVNTGVTGSQAFPSAAALANGDYIVVWTDQFRSKIIGQRFNQAAVPIGDEFVVSRTTSTAEGFPTVAASGNDFLVTWVAGGSIWGNGPFGRIFGDGFDSGDLGAWSAVQP